MIMFEDHAQVWGGSDVAKKAGKPLPLVRAPQQGYLASHGRVPSVNSVSSACTAANKFVERRLAWTEAACSSPSRVNGWLFRPLDACSAAAHTRRSPSRVDCWGTAALHRLRLHPLCPDQNCTRRQSRRDDRRRGRPLDDHRTHRLRQGLPPTYAPVGHHPAHRARNQFVASE
jgi:hypothetical protein